MSFITSLKLLHNLLPEGSLAFAFRVLWETGVRSIVFKQGEDAWAMRLFGIPGACDIETRTIEINLDMNLKRLAEVIFHRHGISIEINETPLWILCHEAAHVMKGPSQTVAEEFAKLKFLDWRLKNESIKR